MDVVEQSDDDRLKAEAEQVLIDGGCQAVRVQGGGDEWFVSCGFEPGQFFVTAFSKRNPNTPNDPIYLARQALATLEKNERPRAPAVDVHETVSQETEVSLGEDNVAAEEEMGESQTHDLSEYEPAAVASDDGGDRADEAPVDLDGTGAGECSDGDAGVGAEQLVREPDDIVDADFSECGDLPTIEGEDLNLPQLTDEEHIQSVASLSSDPGNTGQGGGEGFGGQDRFIGLDDLDRRRSIRIGDVNRYALTIMPLWTSQDHAELVGLRNFAMGVSEKLWPDDTAKAEALMAKEAVLAHVRAVETALMEKVRFLNTANHEAIEGFDPEADWPA